MNTCTKENTGKDLNLYAMSKESLIKKVQILMHELAVYHKYEQEKPNLKDKDMETILKQQIQNEIVIEQLNKNQNVLQTTVKAKINEIQQLQNDLKQQETTLTNLKRENQILKKQIISIQRSKRKQNSDKIDSLSRQAQSRINDLEKENKLLKKTVTELTNKAKILNELNQETEEKLAKALLSLKSFKPQRQQNESNIENKQNNQSTMNRSSNSNNNKLQNFALKEQIRQLRETIRTLQQSKEALKTKFQERQLFYSRMLPLKQ